MRLWIIFSVLFSCSCFSKVYDVDSLWQANEDSNKVLNIPSKVVITGQCESIKSYLFFYKACYTKYELRIEFEKNDFPTLNHQFKAKCRKGKSLLTQSFYLSDCKLIS